MPFDLPMSLPDSAISRLCERPGPLLIGANPSRDETLGLSNQPAQACDLSDLFELARIQDEEGKECYGEKLKLLYRNKVR